MRELLHTAERFDSQDVYEVALRVTYRNEKETRRRSVLPWSIIDATYSYSAEHR